MAFDKGIKLSAGFDLQSPFPLDSRNKVATLSDLNSLTSNDVEPGHITFCEEDKKFYAYIDDVWKDLLETINSTTLYTRTIDSLLFTLNADTTLYEYEFDNPFSNTNVICSLQNEDGISLIETITVSADKVKIELIQPEKVTINMVGIGVDTTIIDKKDNILYSEIIDETSFVLNSNNNLYEYTLTNPFGSVNVVYSLQDADGNGLLESVNVTDTEIKVFLSAVETVTLNVIGDGINGSVVLKDALTTEQLRLLGLVKDKENEISSLSIDSDSDLTYNNKKVLVGYGIETTDLDFSTF